MILQAKEANTRYALDHELDRSYRLCVWEQYRRGEDIADINVLVGDLIYRHVLVNREGVRKSIALPVWAP